MTGCDPDDRHRASTPLELLFDLAFVVASGQAADKLARLAAAGHSGEGTLGCTGAVGGTCLAWINFSWFASAYDTDDWFYQVTTMLEMIGVVIFALGLPVMVDSLVAGDGVDSTVMAAGQVVMRVAMIGHWLRLARQDQARRRTALGARRSLRLPWASARSSGCRDDRLTESSKA